MISKSRTTNFVSRKNFGNGFTLIELLVVIAIIALLVSILLPSLSRAKDLARNALCMSNLKGVAFGISMYTTEYNGSIPPHWDWDQSRGIKSFIDEAGMWGDPEEHTAGSSLWEVKEFCFCPSGGRLQKNNSWYKSEYNSYGFVNTLSPPIESLDDIDQPANEPLGGDSAVINPSNGIADYQFALIYRTYANQSYAVSVRHLMKSNLIFGDFHIEANTVDDLSDLGFLNITSTGFDRIDP